MAEAARQTGATQSTAPESTHPLALLEAGIPLSLLLDLAGMTPALSRELLVREQADTSWVHRLSA